MQCFIFTMMNESQQCSRTKRRHREIVRNFSFNVPDDIPVIVPEDIPLNSDNSSATITTDRVLQDNTLDSDQYSNANSNDVQYSNNNQDVRENNESEEDLDDDFNFEKEFLSIVLLNSVPYSVAEQFMSIINRRFGYKILPKSITTLLRRINSEVYDQKYSFQCKCNTTVHFMVKNARVCGVIKCENCQKIFNGYDDLKEYNYYCSLLIKQQIIDLSHKFSKPDVAEEVSSLSIGIILAVDAIPIFKSNDSSLHVLMCFIDRMKPLGKSAIPIVSTLYFGKGKPALPIFFSKFMIEYQDLSENPFETAWNTHTKIYIKCILADAPCRAWILGMQQFNGKYGCHRCYTKIEDGKWQLKKYSEHRLRTLDETEEYRRVFSHGNHSNVMGINGITPLSVLNNFNYINLVAVEYIHSAILGVVKNLIKNIMFESQWGNRMFVNSARPSIQYFSEKFKSISPPSSIKRYRSLDCMAHYKSSEFENLLFFFAYPLLKDKLKKEYLLHIFLLCSALHKLITKDDENSRQQAIHQLDLFIDLATRLNYPDTLKKYNTHAILHLVEDNRHIGKLLLYNAYGYENTLGNLKKKVKSPTNIVQQIIYQLKVQEVSSRHEDKLVLKKEVFPEFEVQLQASLEELRIPAKSGWKFFKKCQSKIHEFKSCNYHQKRKYTDHNAYLEGKFYKIEYFAENGNNVYLICREYLKIQPLELNSLDTVVILEYVTYVKLDTRRLLITINSPLLPLFVINTRHNTLCFELFTCSY